MTSLHAHAADPIESPRRRSPDDRDADGVSDADELEIDSDPDVPGLYPGDFPHIPEPLQFDLVRGLGSRRGEFEFNVLTGATLAPYDGVRWAPEVEWAFADRFALEFELPMLNGSVQALKTAVQGTFRERRPKFIHGWQVIAEYLVAPAGELTTLYLSGRRFGRRWSLFGMIGPRGRFDAESLDLKLLVNPSVFVDVDERFTIGVENNGVVRGVDSSITTLPQFHLQISRHFRVQVGGGVAVDRDGVHPQVGLRLIVE